MRSIWSAFAAILLSAASAALRFGGREDEDIEKNAGEMSDIVNFFRLNIWGWRLAEFTCCFFTGQICRAMWHDI